MKKTTYSTTVPALVGKNIAAKPLAESYLDWIDHPASEMKFEQFGAALDKTLKLLLPNHTLSGWLAGKEEDIRQDAATELFKGFLAGNSRLRAAVHARSLRKIANAMTRCIGTCLANNRKRTLDEEAAHKGTPIKQHPTEAQISPHGAEYLMRLRMADLLISAEAAQDLGADEIELLRRLVVDEASRDQTAAEMKRSVSWISKRLKKIKGKLQKSKALLRILEADM